MYQISKEFSFSASHQLNNLLPGHPCGRLHGHNYVIKIVLTGKELDNTGFILDYGELKQFQEYIDNTLDHRHLNDLLKQPSAENIAKHLYEVAAGFYGEKVEQVMVSETPKTRAVYYE